MTRTRSIHIAAGAVVGLALLTACGSSGQPHSMSSSSAPSASSSSISANTGPHNAQDVTFAQDMIPHHEQAIAMATMVPSHTTNQAVIKLATQIEAAQAPEIAELQSWLGQWGASAPVSPGAHDGGHGASSGGSGMMSADQMRQLEQANGAAFDKLWLQMMIAHHEGAVTMAQAEIGAGQNPEAKAMAQAIITGQTAEIDQMKKMLQQ